MVLVATPDNPIPGETQSGYLHARDRVRIRYASWPARTKKPRGTVCLMHGRTEFIEKYFEVAEDLRRLGFAVVTFDWRGQGGSDRLLRDRMKGHVDDFKDYELDLDVLFKQVILPDCPPPYYALAHSTGGAIALMCAPRLRTRFERMVLTAPLLRLEKLGTKSRWIRPLVETLGSFGLHGRQIPGATTRMAYAADFENNIVTSDKERFERTKAIGAAAPYLTVGAPTIGWLRAAFHAMDGLFEPEFTRNVKVPILLVASGADAVVSARAIEEFSAQTRAAGHVIIPGAKHEIMMERDGLRDQFWAALEAFLPK